MMKSYPKQPRALWRILKIIVIVLILMNRLPRIARIIITQPNTYLRLGKSYNIAPTPYNQKGTNPNSRYGVWVFARNKEVVFVPFACFLVVEYRFFPSAITYGFVPSKINPSGTAYWDNEISRKYFLQLRAEYWNLE